MAQEYFESSMNSGYADLNLDEIRKHTKSVRSPQPHQLQAFEALDSVFAMPVSGYKGALLVLPTGSGKTYTAVSWLSKNVLSRNCKVLWLAQSAYLLDQAMQSFVKEAGDILPPRKTLKIRTVSSSRAHSNSGCIQRSDDVVIVTTQSAGADIAGLTLGLGGEQIKYKLRQWVEACAEDELFVVLDEAHHAPAYGCRMMLLELRRIVPDLYVLGLTATPTHNDARIRGWLDRIFDHGVCYQADENKLYQSRILAVPNYIEKSTCRNIPVDDRLYERIVRQHKDLPEDIVESLANDSARNNMIISDYVASRDEYGKTIIFADRWFQCEYLVDKLRENNVRADSVYVRQSGNRNASAEGYGRRDNKDNEEALRKFRSGEIDVLVNVKMLTEGVDVPDVKTVIITRNTTSGILFTQMRGRALRGAKFGGGADKDKANIVLFTDNWQRHLPFARMTNITGKADNLPVIRRGYAPLEWVSILAVQRACHSIEFAHTQKMPGNYFIPSGWYDVEFAYAVDDDSEEIITSNEAVMVFQSNSSSFEALIEYALNRADMDEWAAERLDESAALTGLRPDIAGIFDYDVHNVDNKLDDAIVNIMRHIAQNGEAPRFIPLDELQEYNIDNLVASYADLSVTVIKERLKHDFSDERKLWGKLYQKFDYFRRAFYDALHRDDDETADGSFAIRQLPQEQTKSAEEFRKSLLSRDNKRCVCCNKPMGKGVPLEIDHIIPVRLGGKNELSNLQLLCKRCNAVKSDQALNFKNNRTAAQAPGAFRVIRANCDEYLENTVERIINFFYRCDATASVSIHQRRNGRYYSIWKIQLHEGNNPEWLIAHKQELLVFIREDLGWGHVTDLEIVN